MSLRFTDNYLQNLYDAFSSVGARQIVRQGKAFTDQHKLSQATAIRGEELYFITRNGKSCKEWVTCYTSDVEKAKVRRSSETAFCALPLCFELSCS